MQSKLNVTGPFISINGATQYRWRAVDQDGNVLAVLVQRRRDKPAAKQFFRRLLKRLADVPRVVSTDKRARDDAAKRDILPSVEHRRHTGLNNRAEHAHQPTRERARRMRRCKSPGHAQRFLAAYGPIADHFRPRRHRLTAAASPGTLRHLAGRRRHPRHGLTTAIRPLQHASKYAPAPRPDFN